MTEEEKRKALEEALERFKSEVERLKREHTAKVEAILKEIRERRLEKIKKDLGM